MEIVLFVIIGILAVVFAYGVTIYNNLVSLKHNVDKA